VAKQIGANERHLYGDARNAAMATKTKIKQTIIGPNGTDTAENGRLTVSGKWVLGRWDVYFLSKRQSTNTNGVHKV